MKDAPAMPAELLSSARALKPELAALLAEATEDLRARVAPSGKVDAAALDLNQHAAHALSWLATYVEALGQLTDWAGRLDEAGRLGRIEALILQIGLGEYLTQIRGGIPMSQTEFARLSDLGLDWQPGVAALALIGGNTPGGPGRTGGADAGQPWPRDLRRLGAGRGSGDDPRPVPPLCRGPGDPERA